MTCEEFYRYSEYLQIPIEKLLKYTNDDIELCYLSISKLKLRFETKINPEEYFLAYSGGKDSHLLYWFIKYYLKDDDIKIVGVNTYREHSEIRDRIYKNCDVVLYPTMKMNEINEKYGMPCFTKQQDEYIYRWQNQTRTEYLKLRIYGGEKSKFNLNKKARELLLNEELHKVSNKCCEYTKKKPMVLYEKQSKRKSIVGVRGSESITRNAMYKTCLTTKGKFTPLYDFTDAMCSIVETMYDIEIPKIYNLISRTGCIGCVYAQKNILNDISSATKGQIKYAIDSFDKSYKVKGYYDQIIEIYNSK